LRSTLNLTYTAFPDASTSWMAPCGPDACT
jgi:hypothetical protein